MMRPPLSCRRMPGMVLSGQGTWMVPSGISALPVERPHWRAPARELRVGGERAARLCRSADQSQRDVGLLVQRIERRAVGEIEAARRRPGALVGERQEDGI